MTILGTRPEIIRLSLIIKRLDRFADRHVLVHTGQNYDKSLSDIFFEQLRIRLPDHTILTKTRSFGQQVGAMLSEVEKIIETEKPDKILVLGDTNSALCAVLGARMNIPVFHMEAGNRCFDPLVPEETNRRIIDAISDFNLPYTETSRENLLREGIPAKRVWVSGNPIREVLNHYVDDISASHILDTMDLKTQAYMLATIHRAENVDNPVRLKNITGGTGSWGHELTHKLLKTGVKQIRILSRNEFAQVRMQRTFSGEPRLQFLIGDVRDSKAVHEACKGVDIVFHLSALKHVPICEAQPEEALKTNVQGTMNVIAASIAAGVEKVIDVSTDKAVDPINFYGMTKALGEKLMIHANGSGEHTKFVCIRGGNVLGTNGSVVPFFKAQILSGGEITLTHEDMTRFFLTIHEAIDLLLEASGLSIGGETLVMKMKACKIRDLANVMARCLISKPLKIHQIGIRPGEKLHEVLVSRYESPHTYKYSDKYYAILPSPASEALQTAYQSLEQVPFVEYSSSVDLMSEAEIERMLRQGGFLP